MYCFLLASAETIRLLQARERDVKSILNGDILIFYHYKKIVITKKRVFRTPP